MAKSGKHNVSFVAVKPVEQHVAFRTRNGEKVSFEAVKPTPVQVTFEAKNK